jgi:hypothetical protein
LGSEAKRVRGAVEGDAYGVPLPSGGFATVVVARVAPKGGVTLGYFFGPRSPTVPDVGSLEGLRREGATLILQFGDLGIVEGTWRRIGRIPDWDRRKWPMPPFKRRGELDGRSWRVQYDDNPNSIPRESPIGDAEAAGLPQDGLYGADAAARVLDLRIAEVAR